MASLSAIQTILLHQKTTINSDLSRQLIQKLNILGTYLNSIQNAKTTIEKSQRLIDIVGMNNYQNTSQYESYDEL